MPTMDNQDGDQRKPGTTDTTDQKVAETTSSEKRNSSAEPKQAASPATDTQVNDVADDTANDDKLTSPPDTSSVSSVNPDVLGDEIIVGTRANGAKSPARRAVSVREDVTMADADDDEPVLPKRDVRRDPKRKRPLENDYDDTRDATAQAKDTVYDTDASVSKGRRERQKAEDESKHVPIGYWRDSPVPNERGKHRVIGFIDARDRLRTRIRNVNLNGEAINVRLFPVPPGPGGSWVTFERIVFLDHLIGHDHNVIKEYVRARAETNQTRTEEADVAAVREAQHRLSLNPPPETNQPPAIAWGQDLPESVQRPETKRRRYGSAAGSTADRPEGSDRPERQERQERLARNEQSQAGPIEPQPQAEILPPPRKPTRILVGVWSKSPPPDEDDKHAVFGILGANDMFRVKLVKETKDGRFMEDSFPTGAGALWISYDEVIFLDHLKDLIRPEIKEYVRIRQAQIDAGEVPAERVANETQAVHQAQIRVAQAGIDSPVRASPQMNSNHSNAASQAGSVHEEVRDSPELRHARRDATPRSAEIPRQSRSYPSEIEIRQAGQINRTPSNDPIERVQGFANREVARMEAVQMRTDRHQANRNAVASPGFNPSMYDPHRDFQDNVQRMDHVWRAQENMRMGPLNGSANGPALAGPSNGPINGPINGNRGDAMMHQGIKYERKSNGPFKDRLVSQGTIINIDGEDYVEYRVLTKPTFF
ncbi:uncharacterized protein GGS22DRAFT_137230 [Annulohypoxylon maeteangense]|uniref:uncharacterized protein n=1 Tax=Annulohypoxylon maeteangense TaxID=1927788 RepID=UPI002007F1E9|nr:uncharacterized protein GGS22DRAFT_137230 [Annulohypoxylon maeteangense]KAI0885005.1 hypothetical protein GGS22DRAFT_137230 [Annulohypoxylon maeteangense]